MLPNPIPGALSHLQSELDKKKNEIASNLIKLQLDAARNLSALLGEASSKAENLRRGIDSLRRAAASHLHQAPLAAVQWMQQQQAQLGHGQEGLQQGAAMLPLASLSLAHRPPTPTPCLGDLALHPIEIEARLRDVTVYTLLDSANQFILVSGEGNPGTGEQKNLGLFFMCREDADAVLQKMGAADPEMAKKAKVVEVGLDKVYTFTTREVPSELSEVSFRIFPAMSEVQAAMEVLGTAGVPQQKAFPGVPLFQAEGLTVKGEVGGDGKMTPLFFSKTDLDSAVRSAYDKREQRRVAAAEEAVGKARVERDKASREAERAREGGEERGEKKALQRVERAQVRLDKASRRLEDALRSAKAPRVEVGTLEEVLSSMERDVKGEWTDVMFVPPGAISAKAGGGMGGKR